MNNFAPLPPPAGRMLLLPIFAVALSASAFAQQSPYSYQNPPPGYGYPQQRPGVGERVGGFVRRLFYGETSSAYRQPPQYGYPSGRSLDSQPSASSRYSSPPPAYSQPPPASASRSSVTPPSATSKSQSSPPPSKPSSTKSAASKSSSSSGKYTPPKIKPDAPPAPSPSPKVAVPDSPPIPPKPEPKIEPKIEQTPPSPQLDNTPTPPPTTLASVSKSLPDLEIPTIKQPDTPASPTLTNTPVTPKEETPPPPAADSSSGQFLVGKKTAVPGRVISPYPPYQELDVSGLASGSLALDPTTDKVFEIP